MAIKNYLVILIAFIAYQAHSAAVLSDAERSTSLLTWARDAPVDIQVGPGDAVYCRVRSPNGDTYFENFGTCKITVERASEAHTGTWILDVGRPNHVLTEEQRIVVAVHVADPKPEVTVSVVEAKPLVTLSCSVVVPEAVTSCKFRDPSGRIFLGTGIGVEAGYEISLQSNRCALTIDDPVVAELGLWRCALETPSDTYYGFLTVLCPFAMMDPSVAAQVVTEPSLTADRTAITALEFTDSVTMSCSVQAPIRYCYFRNRSGRTMSIAPGNTGVANAIAEYAGAGFDAGECGIRYSAMQSSDSGEWTCHVGFVDTTMPEQRATLNLQIDEFMVAKQEVTNNVLQIEARVYWNRPLDYCRFVRMDGLGFTTANLPAGYTSNSVLANGLCSLRINNPSIIEHHPWAVVARVQGTDYELMRDTTHTIPPGTGIPDGHPDVGGSDEVESTPDQTPDQIIIVRENTTFTTVWLAILTVMFGILLISMLIVPKRNRQWIRSVSMRRSFNPSVEKPPMPANYSRDNNSVAA